MSFRPGYYQQPMMRPMMGGAPCGPGGVAYNTRSRRRRGGGFKSGALVGGAAGSLVGHTGKGAILGGLLGRNRRRRC